MGMFDYFRSSYDLGEEFTNIECQTKDMEDGIGGTLSQYWLDPHGYLYYIDYTKTHDFVEINEVDDEYDPVRLFLNYKWVPNGNHGKIRPYMITKYVEVYPSNWNGPWDEWPRCLIHFKYGRLTDYETFSRNERRHGI